MEQWFLIEGASRVQRKLNNAKVAYVPLNVVEPRKISGFAFSESQKDSVLLALGMLDTSFTEEKTDNKLVWLLDADMSVNQKKGLLERIRGSSSGLRKPPNFNEATRDAYIRECKRVWERRPSEEDIRRWSNDYEDILRLPGVVKVEVSRRKIKVYTETIRIKYGIFSYRIGKFRIEYTSILNRDDMIYNRHTVRCFNLSESMLKKRGIRSFHPHVSSNSEPCLGNIKDSIRLQLRTAEYYLATELMLVFLKSVNDSGQLAYIKDWPRSLKK